VLVVQEVQLVVVRAVLYREVLEDPELFGLLIQAVLVLAREVEVAAVVPI
jgi:hypothetical protein